VARPEIKGKAQAEELPPGNGQRQTNTSAPLPCQWRFTGRQKHPGIALMGRRCPFSLLNCAKRAGKKHEKYPQLSGKIWKINDLHNMMLKEREVERRTADGREWMRMF